MKAKLVLTLIAPVLFGIKTSAYTSMNCEDDRLHRIMTVEREGDEVIVYIGYPSNEINLAQLPPGDDLGAIQSSFRKASNVLLIGGDDGSAKIRFSNRECSFNPTDDRVIRCMHAGGVGVLIESHDITTISDSGKSVTRNALATEISVPMTNRHNDRLNLKYFYYSSEVLGGEKVYEQCAPPPENGTG